EIHRVVAGPGVRVSEDLDGGEPHGSGHAVAVLEQLLEGGVAALLDVHLDAVQDRLEVLARHGERAHDLGQVDRDGLARLTLVGATELGAPLAEDLPLLAGVLRPLVDGVVHRPAEGVERVDRLALAPRQEQERVVEVRPAATGQDGGALGGVHDLTRAGTGPTRCGPDYTRHDPARGGSVTAPDGAARSRGPSTTRRRPGGPDRPAS